LADSRGADRHDLIVIAMGDQRRHVELFQVLGEVGFGERLDAVERGLDAGLHALKPEGVAGAFGDLRALAVVA
jgi:hypothetical protein